MYSLFRLSTSAFCVSIAENVQNYGLCKSAPCCSTQCLSCARSKRAIPSWRTDRPTECVTDCLTDGERTDGQTDWLAGWLNDRLPDGRTNWLTDIPVGWLTEGCKNGRTASLTSCFTVWPTGTETDVRTDWLTDGQIDWLVGWLTELMTRIQLTLLKDSLRKILSIEVHSWKPSLNQIVYISNRIKKNDSNT